MGNINRISPIHPIPSATITMSVPAFSDIAKSSNDLLSKDFYHLNATTFELKSSTPSNVGFKVTGKSTHEGSNSGLLEAKYADKPSGLTLTQTWNTVNALDTKIELNDAIAKGLKAEVLGSFLPASQNKGAKFNLHFKQANFHGRAFFDLLKGNRQRRCCDRSGRLLGRCLCWLRCPEGCYHQLLCCCRIRCSSIHCFRYCCQ